jgi:hypothetical protein
MRLDWKEKYKEYFLTRRKLSRKISSFKAVRMVSQKMQQIFWTYAAKYTDPDLAFADYSIWPFGKGTKKFTIFQFYVDTITGEIYSFNYKAAQKILGIEPFSIIMHPHLIFVTRSQFNILSSMVKRSEYKTTTLKDIKLLALDKVVTPVDAYLRRINYSTCRVLFVFRLKDCFISRHPGPGSGNSKPPDGGGTFNPPGDNEPWKSLVINRPKNIRIIFISNKLVLFLFCLLCI